MTEAVTTEAIATEAVTTETTKTEATKTEVAESGPDSGSVSGEPTTSETATTTGPCSECRRRRVRCMHNAPTTRMLASRGRRGKCLACKAMTGRPKCTHVLPEKAQRVRTNRTRKTVIAKKPAAKRIRAPRSRKAGVVVKKTAEERIAAMKSGTSTAPEQQLWAPPPVLSTKKINVDGASSESESSSDSE